MNVRDALMRTTSEQRVDGFDPCWIWQGAVQSAGYGHAKFDDGDRLVHREIYESIVGPIPPDLELDHRCRQTLCCNPHHLEPVTHAVNARRGRAGEHERVKTSCPKGHAYDERNTYRNRRGKRFCRACKNERERAKRREARAA